MKLPTRRLLAVIASSLVWGCLLVACATDDRRPLTSADLESISKNDACENPLFMTGDPDYWGSAAGLYCLPEEGVGVVIRVYDQSDATTKVIGDWVDLIDEQNQIVYGQNWFATGPPSTLNTLLGQFDHAGPQPTTPAASEPTVEESNMALCSSITYGVVSQAVGGGDASNLQQYYDSYPGLEDLASTLLSQAKESGIRPTGDDDLFLAAKLTKFDSSIKEFCRQQI